MKLQKISQGLNISKASAGIILALASSLGHAAARPVSLSSPEKIYVGLFGGIASPNNYDANQYGTAFISEAGGGPLAVNAFGEQE